MPPLRRGLKPFTPYKDIGRRMDEKDPTEHHERASDRLPGKNLFGKRDGEVGNLLGVAGAMGLHMVTCPLVAGLAGWGLDRLFGTRWIFLVTLFLGIIAGFRCVWQDAKRLEHSQREAPRPKKNPPGTEEP